MKTTTRYVVRTAKGYLNARGKIDLWPYARLFATLDEAKLVRLEEPSTILPVLVKPQ